MFNLINDFNIEYPIEYLQMQTLNQPEKYYVCGKSKYLKIYKQIKFSACESPAGYIYFVTSSLLNKTETDIIAYDETQYFGCIKFRDINTLFQKLYKLANTGEISVYEPHTSPGHTISHKITAGDIKELERNTKIKLLNEKSTIHN